MRPEPFAADDLDFRILREFFVGPGTCLRSDFPSLEDVAAAVNVHPNTVSARVQRMTRAGFFFPLISMPNCNRLGLVGGRAFYPFPLAERPPQQVASILRHPGTFSAIEFVEGWEVLLFARSAAELEAAAKTIREIIGAPAFHWEARWDKEGPTGSIYRPSPVELRLMDALLADVRRPMAKLAQELGVTPRTAQRYADRLRREAILHVAPGGHAVCGSRVIAYVGVEFASSAAGAEASGPLKALMPNSFLIVTVPCRQRLFIWGENIGSITDQAQAVASLPGVSKVTLRFVLRYAWNPAFQGYLRALLEETSIPEPFTATEPAPTEPAVEQSVGGPPVNS